MYIIALNIARLHPVLVHLPIGFLLLTLLLEILGRNVQSEGYKKAIGIGLLSSLIASVFTLISGFLLASQNQYDETLFIHKWLGISTAFLSLALYLGQSRKVKFLKIVYPYLVPITIIVVSLTGHFGGALTHGPDYLFTFPKNDISKGEIFNPSAPVGHIVEIKQFKFVPQSLDVKLGDTVTFINKDFVPHDITDLVDKSWSSGTLNSGDTWSLIPDVDIDYYCSLHIIMKGKIRIID